MRKWIAKVAKRVRRILSKGSDDSVWCAVANVHEEWVLGPDGVKRRSGTKHFRNGTLVCCSTPLWGDGYKQIKVVARHRGSHRFVTMVIRSAWLVNWRVKLVYSPHVIREFQKMGAQWDGSVRSRWMAGRIVRSMRKLEKTAH